MADKRKPKPIGPRDSMGGREVEAPPMQWYERGQDSGQGTTTYRSRPFEAPPAMPAGVSRGRGMTDAEIGNWLKTGQPKEYNNGGAVKKGSYSVPAMCGSGKVLKSWSK